MPPVSLIRSKCPHLSGFDVVIAAIEVFQS